MKQQRGLRKEYVCQRPQCRCKGGGDRERHMSVCGRLILGVGSAHSSTVIPLPPVHCTQNPFPDGHFQLSKPTSRFTQLLFKKKIKIIKKKPTGEIFPFFYPLTVTFLLPALTLASGPWLDYLVWLLKQEQIYNSNSHEMAGLETLSNFILLERRDSQKGCELTAFKAVISLLYKEATLCCLSHVFKMH